MIDFLNSRERIPRLGRWFLIAAMLVGCFVGCAGWNGKVQEDKPEKTAENELSKSVRKARPQKSDGNYSALTDKGRQIERDFNALE
jgi:hypothetical protein